MKNRFKSVDCYSNLRKTIIVGLSALVLAGCVTSGTSGGSGNTTVSIPNECGLPAGITVTSIAIDTATPLDINQGVLTPVSVTATISQSVSSSDFGAVCFEVKDSEIVRGAPLTVGFIPFTSAVGTSNTLEQAFNVTCDGNNEVAGVVSNLTNLIAPDAASADRSSGERRTGIRVQELRGIQSLNTPLGSVPVGVTGERSGRIRIRCP